MAKSTKIFNKFNRSYKDLRKFLRLVSYGCYHRNQFSNYGITPRTYDDFLRQLRFFIPFENIQVHRQEKFSYSTFSCDFQTSSENYLYRSFLLKTILPENFLYSITILQILEQSKKPLSISEIVEIADEKISELKPETLEKDLPQLLRRRLKALENSGVLKSYCEGGKFFYRQFKNPLGELSADELKILSSAVNFYKNYSLIPTAGYFFSDSLNDIFKVHTPNFFQFKNNNFIQLLDDDILFSTLDAVKNHRQISYKRENQSTITVMPFAIETDFLYGRQYIWAVSGKESFKFRTDKIIDAEISELPAQNFSAPNKKLREIKLRVTFQNETERNKRIEILNAETDFKIVSEENNAFICAIEVEDPLQFYPHLWKFQPWAKILPGVDGLRERMLNDAKEVLKNYAEPV